MMTEKQKKILEKKNSELKSNFNLENSETGHNEISDNADVERPRALAPNKNSDNSIFIGNKPLVNYIRGVITHFTKLEAQEVVIKSRGKFISKAVDVVEVAKRSLEEQRIYVKDINIASESFETDGKKTNVSTMNIVLGKK